MKRHLILCLVLTFTTLVHAEMGGWTSHMAYGSTSEVVHMQDHVYAIADGSLYAVSSDGELEYWTKQNGLSGASVVHIAKDTMYNQLVIVYADGLIDLMDHNQNIVPIQDLKIKQMNQSKQANTITLSQGLMYMAMPFGIVVINLQKKEVLDTYYIGQDGAEENIVQIAVLPDSIYAISDHTFFSAPRQANLLDYSQWNRCSVSGIEQLHGLCAVTGSLLLHDGSQLYARQQGQWQPILSDIYIRHITENEGQVYASSGYGIFQITSDSTAIFIDAPWPLSSAIRFRNEVWAAAYDNGVACISSSGTQKYQPVGPLKNIPYRIKVTGQHVYVVPGSRWAVENRVDGCVMRYDGQQWLNITSEAIHNATHNWPMDFMNVAEDPNDSEHFFVTSFGTGLYEFNGDQLVKYYHYKNSPIMTRVLNQYSYNYMRTDAAQYDTDGNLWLICTGKENGIENFQIIQPSDLVTAHQQDSSGWFTMNIYDHSSREQIVMICPQEMMMDSRNPNWIWIPHGREQTGLVLLNTNSTPFKSSDDKALMRRVFVDQKGKTIEPERILCAAQDKDHTLWVGTEEGLFTLTAEQQDKFFTSNECTRIIIPRNDGTDLADYLLQTEVINAIAVDGSNRKWIGTESSGLYLMSADGIETLQHFTQDNSPLPSNTILSLGIEPQSGRVFVGTSAGLMSYLSDATAPEENYQNIYAYPNPVYRDYTGLIAIRGLMDHTVIHIVDGAGNLVCETRGNGGIATWNGKNGYGERVASGIYSVLCNTADGKSHCVTKIMIMH